MHNRPRGKKKGAFFLAFIGGRTSAIGSLAAALPPTILAELLGISDTSASKWYRLAGGEWNRYAARSSAT